MRHRSRRKALRVNPDVAHALEATPDELDSLARRASELGVCNDLEGYLYRRIRAGTVGRLIHIEGLENLEAALEGGRGVILFSGHIRSAHLFFAALAELGHPPSIVGFPPGDRFLPVDRRFLERRAAILEQKFGCRYIWMTPDNFGVAVKAANVLERNGVVVMYVDGTRRETSVDVSFFGARYPFASGPAVFAQTTGAPLLDYFVHRDGGWVPQTGEIGAPFFASGDVEETTQLCAMLLEAHVRRHPAQWGGFSSYAGSTLRDAERLRPPA
jgi:lauroyl/myristoyl acyltransferase